MVKESLYIKVMQDGEEVNFPINGDEPVRLNTATYTAQRMGSAPTITADFYYPRILDNDWTHKEYVTFRGEKYYVDMTPSAQKDNSNLLYKHSITLVSERIKLEHEFFYDVVTEDTEVQYADRYRSNISKFSFYGDIEEFAARLTDSLIYTGFCKVTTDANGNKVYDGYHVVVTEGITSDIIEVSFENKRIAEALQEINTSFELAYYFVGKEIRIGYTENLIEHIFDYGRQDGLLKIEHNNSNDAIVDRITGTGSSDNLPYYYPNETADGTALYKVENSGVEGDDVVKSANMASLYKSVTYPIGKTLRLHHVDPYREASYSFLFNEASVSFSSYIADSSGYGSYHWGYTHDGISSDDDAEVIDAHNNNYDDEVRTFFIGKKSVAESGMSVKCANILDISNFRFAISGKGSTTDLPYMYLKQTWGVAKKTTTSKGGKTDTKVTSTSKSVFGNTLDFVDENGDYWVVVKELTGDSYYDFATSDEFRVVSILHYFLPSGTIYNVRRGNVSAVLSCPITVEPCYFHQYSDNSGYWFTYLSDNEIKEATYENSGITFREDVVDSLNRIEHTVSYDDTTGFVVNDGDETQTTTEVTITGRRWISPTTSLMPSLYRNSLGAERYFNAYNGENGYERSFEWENGNMHTFDYKYAYTIGQSSDLYTFLNLYEEGNPHADNQEFEEIKPTIKDVRNDVILRKTTDGDYSDSDSKTYVTDSEGEYIYENYDDDGNPAGQLYGEIAAVAFDDNDSDVLKNTSDSGTKEYVHSYFYIKLHKFSGDMAFNLFDQASESDTAKIEMTSGNCAGCSFEIGVPEPTEVEDGKYIFKNPVQVVEETGEIVAGDYKSTTIAEGDFGEKIKVGRYQDCQQDTTANEVWIALKKENSTYGIVMPNASQNYRPQAGDTFVITGINAPLSYITAAEKRLDKALVEYMSDTNVEKWNFSITFSRIWLTEHPEIANQLNENARIYVRYNGVDTLLYVTSYSVKMDSNILEEITVELADEIDDLSQGSLTTKLNSLKEDIVSTVRNSDFSSYIATSKKYFLNRRSDASEDERTMRARGIFAKGADLTDINVSADAAIGGDTTIGGSATIADDTVIGGSATIGGNTSVVGTTTLQGDTTHHGATQFGADFLDALLGTGGRIDAQGYGVLRGLRLWESLEVPELRYNRVSVNTGVDWDTFGGGIIESVVPDTDEDGNTLNSGVITLKLESGEIGTIAENDLCMGVYHNVNGGNAEESSDPHNGNFTFAGFSTVYFRVDEILETSDNSQFRYVLRGDGWNTHPQAQMHFACYANPTDKTRQACRYSTTRYIIALHDMTTWTYSGSNLYLIIGELDGFTMNGKTFSGTGIVLGNAYIYGNIEQWLNSPMRIDIDTGSDNLIDYGESKTISAAFWRGWENLTADATDWSIKRETSDTDADAEWNDSHTRTNYRITLTDEDLPDLEQGALFTISATYDGTTIEQSVIIRHRFSSKGFSVEFAEPEDIYDPDRFNTTLTIIAKMYEKDITSLIEDAHVVWSRYSEDPKGNEKTASDTIWNNKHGSDGKQLTLTFSDIGKDSTGMPSVVRFTATVTLYNSKGEVVDTDYAIFKYN